MTESHEPFEDDAYDVTGEPYDQDAAYQTEAAIIARYIIAADESIGKTLRDSLHTVVHEAVKQTWSRPETTSAFQQQLAQYFSQTTHQVLTRDKNQVLFHQLKDTLAGQWQEAVENAVSHGVREFLERKIQLAQPHQDPIDQGVNAVNVEQALAAAVKSALQTKLTDDLTAGLQKTLEQKLDDQTLRDIVQSAISAQHVSQNVAWSRVDPVMRWSLIGAFALPFLFIMIWLWWFSASTTRRFNALQENLGAPASVSSRPTNNPAPFFPEGPSPALRDTFALVMDNSDTSDPNLQVIHGEPQAWFAMLFGIIDPDKAANIQRLKNDSTYRHKHLEEAYALRINTPNHRAIAIYTLQRLARDAGDKKRNDTQWWNGFKEETQIQTFLDGFQCDGGFGPGTIAYVKHVLSTYGENPANFFPDGKDAPTSEILLAAYLILQELARP